jgi:hypothetical protein
MVGVRMRDERRIDTADAFAERLGSEVQRGIDQDVYTVPRGDDRGASAAMSRIDFRKTADVLFTPCVPIDHAIEHWDAMRGAGPEEDDFHR